MGKGRQAQSQAFPSCQLNTSKLDMPKSLESPKFILLTIDRYVLLWPVNPKIYPNPKGKSS